MLGVGTAQIALSYGADDIDGTVRHELIYHDAGATTPEVLSVDDIRRLIIEAGREPIERDTLYRLVVARSETPVAGRSRTRISGPARTGCASDPESPTGEEEVHAKTRRLLDSPSAR